MLKLITGCALAAGLGLALAACVGGRSSQRSAIEAAIRRSPFTYFAYRNPLYWGRSVHVTISRLRVSSRNRRFAAAVVTPFDGKRHRRVSDPERVLLRLTDRWRVIRAETLSAARPACRFAPAGVIAELFGGCDHNADAARVSPEAFISGPLDFRSPTPDERAAIVAATRAAHFKPGQARCVRYHVRVSVVDERFASVSYSFVRPFRGCLLGNGVSFMERSPRGRWRVKGDAGDAFPCTYAPPGVIRSLFEDCLVLGESGARV
jgi:hypothetical protein